MSTRQTTTPKTKRKVSAAPAKTSAKASRAAATPAATPKAWTRAGDPVRAKSPKRAGVAAKPKASPAMAGNGPVAAAAGDGKAHKPKLVRDSFT
ncbi:MAG TPA: hypothetical protein VJ693_05970, partial [Ideonella sp.]|nr:hypothetical protein [Ideonella sp.]